ncbi:acetyltransferase [Virgibacillus halodenitrificans]|uniref:acetyltransferase n=1 Tax=Virgibacillus halodenitrificans TaxID=1482 RepID=UPI001F282FEA|nr:acetyltransferase [Virgibacillus halodenitrificans]
MEDLVLIGGGGHCKSVIDSLNDMCEFNIIGILDTKENVGKMINGIKIIAEDKELEEYFKRGVKNAFVTVGGVGDNSLRIKLYQLTKKIGYQFPTIIDPTAIVSKTAKIGEGTFIGKGSIINTDVTIGSNCIINTGTIIEHDSKIEANCHIAPGTTLSGAVRIGENSHVGTNSTVIQNISIGSNTVIGAGSVVVEDIDSNEKAFGNPCRAVKT